MAYHDNKNNKIPSILLLLIHIMMWWIILELLLADIVSGITGLIIYTLTLLGKFIPKKYIFYADHMLVCYYAIIMLFVYWQHTVYAHIGLALLIILHLLYFVLLHVFRYYGWNKHISVQGKEITPNDVLEHTNVRIGKHAATRIQNAHPNQTYNVRAGVPVAVVVAISYACMIITTINI
jgi:hypothetical protein